MKTLLIALALIIGLPQAQAETLGNKIRDKIATQNVDLSFDLFNQDVGDHVNIRVGSGIRVFPNDDGDTYSRSEPLRFRFRLGNQINPGILTVGGSTTAGLNGEFIRQFDSQLAAFNLVRNPPYIFDNNRLITGNRVPITAERARQLQSGDYFRYQMRGAISANAGVGTDLGLVDLRAGFTRVFYGDFQIEVYKRGRDRVYVRASSLKQTTRNIGMGLHRSFVLDSFDIPHVDKLADRIIPDTFFKVDLSNMANGKIFAIEYLFDLSDPAAASAYNQFMNYRNWQAMDVARVVNPLAGGDQSVRDTLTLHLTETEALARADAHLSEDQARIRRVVKSETQFSNHSSGGHINIRLIRLSNRTSYVEQNIRLTVDPRQDYNQFYRISTTNFDESFGGWLAFGNEERRRGEANILFELHPHMAIKDFMELNFSYEETDNNFHAGSLFISSDIAQIAGRIHKMLPAWIHGPERDAKDNPIGPGVRGFVYDELPKYANDEVFIDLDIVISKRALGLAATLSNTQIQTVIDTFIDSVFEDQSINGVSNRDYGDIDLDDSPVQNVKECNNAASSHARKNCILQANARSVRKIKERVPLILGDALNQNYEMQWQNLVFLQQDPLFRSIGTGIITRLIFRASELQGKRFEDYVHYSMSIENNKGQKSAYSKGLPSRPEVFRELLKIRNRILNRRFDPSYFQAD